jgi:hypothetical protein
VWDVGGGVGGRLFAPLRCFLTNDEELYGKMSLWMSPPDSFPTTHGDLLEL